LFTLARWQIFLVDSAGHHRPIEQTHSSLLHFLTTPGNEELFAAHQQEMRRQQQQQQQLIAQHRLRMLTSSSSSLVDPCDYYDPVTTMRHRGSNDYTRSDDQDEGESTPNTSCCRLFSPVPSKDGDSSSSSSDCGSVRVDVIDDEDVVESAGQSFSRKRPRSPNVDEAYDDEHESDQEGEYQ
jgi:hypothetical protein